MPRSESKRIRTLGLTAWLAVITLLAFSTFFTATFSYSSTWFKAVWILMAAGLAGAIIKTRMWRNVGSLFIHTAFILLIAGGLLTACRGESGKLLLPPGGVSIGSWIDDADGAPRRLPVSMSLDSFVVKTHASSDLPSDYISHITLANGEHETIGANRPLTIGSYRFYQASYDGTGATLITVNHDPAGGMTICYIAFVMLITGFLIVIINPRGQFRQLLGHRHKSAGLIMSVCLIATAIFWFISPYGSGAPVRPILSSHWLVIHFGLIFTSYFLLCITFILSVASISHPTEKYSALSLIILYPALCLLSAGIATGSVWAGEAWGRYWAWDPKETWALITLMVYVIPLHFRMTPRRLAVFLVCSFLCIVMTYIGVRYLPSIHAYR